MALDETVPSEHDGGGHGFHHSGLDLRHGHFDGGALDVVLDEEKREVFRSLRLCCCGWVDSGGRHWGVYQCRYPNYWCIG